MLVQAAEGHRQRLARAVQRAPAAAAGRGGVLAPPARPVLTGNHDPISSSDLWMFWGSERLAKSLADLQLPLPKDCASWIPRADRLIGWLCAQDRDSEGALALGRQSTRPQMTVDSAGRSVADPAFFWR